MSTPDTTTSLTPTTRLATSEDDRIKTLAHAAFVGDPVFHCFGSFRKHLEPVTNVKGSDNLRRFLRFLSNTCCLSGGRITVALFKNAGEEDKVVAAPFWLPPNKHLVLWKVPTPIRARVIPILERWGLAGLMRIRFDSSHAALEKGYKGKGSKESPDASWYLQLIMTDPEYQGQSHLVREAFPHAPNSIFTLELTTSKSRDQYLHLGF
ncbi:hypothetical protein K443DRAFT_636141 [Laccaria amethystina LaAM-08-1]|uniref:Uncharacterized protein n=1 Tax=Laccaria amethystina LaAM-08-1 TaxID=1095629 RepID=A0A0C9XBR9_9AGAR|nr:hypothetical protein K443DRAFT_636141 [Laccaria amethystina LaAM-08-1]